VKESKHKIYYTIKYFSSFLSEDEISSLKDIPFPIYSSNYKQMHKKVNFTVNYDNLKQIVTARWDKILNISDGSSYVESKYILRFFDCKNKEELCDNQYLSIFPKQLEENKQLLKYTLSEEAEQKIKDEEFRYKVVLFAYFENKEGEEMMFVYNNQTIKFEVKHYLLLASLIIVLFFVFIAFAIYILYSKVKEEQNYFENENESNIDLRSFNSVSSSSSSTIIKDEEEKDIKSY
jgi:hypothetical protein